MLAARRHRGPGWGTEPGVASAAGPGGAGRLGPGPASPQSVSGTLSSSGEQGLREPQGIFSFALMPRAVVDGAGGDHEGGKEENADASEAATAAPRERRAAAGAHPKWEALGARCPARA